MQIRNVSDELCVNSSVQKIYAINCKFMRKQISLKNLNAHFVELYFGLTKFLCCSPLLWRLIGRFIQQVRLNYLHFLNSRVWWRHSFHCNLNSNLHLYGVYYTAVWNGILWKKIMEQGNKMKKKVIDKTITL